MSDVVKCIFFLFNNKINLSYSINLFKLNGFSYLFVWCNNIILQFVWYLIFKIWDQNNEITFDENLTYYNLIYAILN